LLKGRAKIAKEIWPRVLAGLFACVYLFSLATHYDWKKLDLKNSYSFGPLFLLEQQWANEHLRTGDRIMVSVNFMSNQFYFKSQMKGEVISWPQCRSLQQLGEFAREHAVNYGLLDLPIVAYNMDIFGEYFMLIPYVGMRLARELPPPFYRLNGASSIPLLYEIYELRY